MKQASEIRSKIKYLAYRFIAPALADKLRNIYNLKDKFIYDRKLEREVKDLVRSRNESIPISDDINLLEGLHRLFPTYNLSNNYKIHNLVNSARHRLKYLSSFGIELDGKDLVDFGAGHGENLMVVKEFNLNSCTGYDFSDSNFNKHKDSLDSEILNAINFKTLDLVTADIGYSNCDIIVSFSAFEHFADPGEVLNRCYNALRPGGYLYAEFAAYNAPFATHRKIYSGVPYVQNIFSDEVAYDFFYNRLKINEGVNRYTNEKIVNGNPFPEVNRWKILDYEKAFLDDKQWEVVNYTKVYNYQYKWLTKIFNKEFFGLSNDDVHADYLKFVLRKK
jgi:SAM-dependent methyltransferase